MTVITCSYVIAGARNRLSQRTMPGNSEEEFASQFSIGDPDPVPEGSTSEEKLKYAEAVSS